MIDPGIITILSGAGQIQATTSSPQTGTATNIPPALQSLSQGAVLTGLVVRNESNGNTIIKTDRGEIAIRSNIFLRYGNEVVIRFDATGASPRARILSIDGLSPQQFAALGTPSLTDDLVETSQIAGSTLPAGNIALTPSAQTAAALPRDATALLLKAIFLSPSPNPAPGAPNLSNLQAGNNVEIKISLGTPNAENDATIQNLSARYSALSNAQATLPENVKVTLLQTAGTPQTVNPQITPQAAPLPNTPAPAATSNAILLQTVPTAPGTAQTLQTTTTPAAQAQPLQATAANVSQTATIPNPAAPAAQNTSLPQTTLPAAPNANIAQPVATNLAAPVTQASVAANQPQPTLPQTTAPAPVATPLPQTAQQPQAQLPNIPAAYTAASQAARAQQNQFVQVNPQSSETPLTQFTGTIIAREPSGDLVVRTPIGMIKLLPESLSGLANLPVGTNFNIELMSADAPIKRAVPSALLPQQPLTNLPPSLDALLRISNQWPTLQQILDWARTQTHNPALMQELSDRIIPKLDARMGASMLFFLTALRGADAKQWLGDRVSSALEAAGRGDLIQRLTGEFSLLRGLMADAPANLPPPGQWQPFFVPVMYDGQLSQLRFYVKRDKPSKDKRKKQEDTRFIVEVELSEMGELQLDGFVRQKQDATQVDIVLRSLRGLDEGQQQDIRTIFNEASQITGFQGELQFQLVRSFAVRPLEELLADHSQTISA